MAKKSDATASEQQSEGRKAMLDKALGDIVKRYGDGSIMRLGEAHKMAIDFDPDRFALARPCARRWRNPARANHRNLWTGIIRKNNLMPAHRS